MKIRLYRNNAERNRVNKDNYLTYATEYNGILKDETTLTNPIITIRNTNNTLFKFNYAYIVQFERYYFIDDIKSVSNGLWELTLSVDVLMSFESDIKSTYALISRNEFDFNESIKDDLVNYEYNTYVEENEIVSVDESYRELREEEMHIDEVVGGMRISTQPIYINGKIHLKFHTPTRKPDTMEVLEIRYYDSETESEKVFTRSYPLNTEVNNVLELPNGVSTYELYILFKPNTEYSVGVYNPYTKFNPSERNEYNTIFAYMGKGTETDTDGNEVTDFRQGIGTSFPPNDVLSPVVYTNGEMINKSLRIKVAKDGEQLINNMALKVKNDDILSTFIPSIIVYPFKIPTKEDITMTGIQVENDSLTQISGLNRFPSFIAPQYILNSEFTITGRTGTFIDYAPFTRYEIFVPYFDYVEVDANLVLNKKLQLIYKVSYTNPSATAYIVNITDNILIWSGAVQIGVKVALSTTNAREIEVARSSNMISTTLSSLSSVISIIGGAMSGNGVGASMGVVSLGKSVASGITTANSLYTRANAQVTNGSDGIYSPNIPRLRKTFVMPIEYDSNFCSLYGKPLNRYMKLNELTGFTKCKEFHLEEFSTALSSELNEIEQTLKDGIIL